MMRIVAILRENVPFFGYDELISVTKGLKGWSSVTSKNHWIKLGHALNHLDVV